jgi:hypothetical protein
MDFLHGSEWVPGIPRHLADPFRSQLRFCGARQGVVHDLLRLRHDCLEMLLVAKLSAYIL